MDKAIFLILFFIFSLSCAQQAEQDVTISLFATDLKGCDEVSACDTVVRILCSSASSDWKECGKTEEMSDDNFPIWPERFTFNYKPTERQRWKFDLVDMDVLINDPIGSVTVTVEDFLVATDTQTTMKFDVNGRGSFYIHRRSLK